MSAHLDRAFVLFEQSRHHLAEQELRCELLTEPNNPIAHALLGLCLAEAKQYTQATQEAHAAIRLAPDVAFVHYAHAAILHDRMRLKEAEAAIAEAIRLDPARSDFYAILAAIQLDQRWWPQALEAAERGLQLDSEHVGCTNLRAMALVKLGRRPEALITIGSTLARDPENALSHANQGWALLEQGERKKALEHFREALRLNPQLEWARQGVIETLKAKHFLYGFLLRYFFWMSKLSARAQWGVVVGGYLGYRVLLSMARDYPDIAPVVWPILILYILFAFLTWVADPLFNLLLRLDRFGRLALSREQTVASNWVGVCLLGVLFFIVVWLATRHQIGFIGALMCGLLVLPLSGTFRCHRGWPRTLMACYTGLLALIGGLFVAQLIVSPSETDGSPAPEKVMLLTLFLLGSVLSGWMANFLMMVRPKR